MPIQALLGATGSTGGAILQYLLDEPIEGLELRVLVRSKSKLLKAQPKLEGTTAFKIEIIEGNLDDTPAMEKALNGAEVIYDCISSNDSGKGVSIARDAAQAILNALRSLKKSQGVAYKKPYVLMNRSNSLNEEAQKEGGFAKLFVHFALYYCYDDIAKAAEQFRNASKDEDLLELICVDPPALHAGTKRTGHTLKLTGETFRSITYPDLGAAFVEIGKRSKEFSGEGVLVGATGDVEEHWDVLIGYLSRGVRARVLGF